MVVLSDLRSSWKALELTLYCATAVLESAANNKVMNFIVDRRIGEAVCNGRFVLIVLGMMMKLDNEERNHRNRRKCTHGSTCGESLVGEPCGSRKFLFDWTGRNNVFVVHTCRRRRRMRG
jgi:hypothetical protein